MEQNDENLSEKEELVAEDLDVCEYCGGTGEVTTMEEAEPGNPQTLAPIGTQKCICQLQEHDGDGDDD